MIELVLAAAIGVAVLWLSQPAPLPQPPEERKDHEPPRDVHG